VIAFNRTTERVVPFDLDRAGSRSLISGIVADGQTSLFDAMLGAVREIEASRRSADAPRREAIVVLSDGEDTASRLGF
jgi:Mg-chelatase subunit ChlD